MKKYQIILPIALPFALIVSVIYMIQNRTKTNEEYQGYLQAAQEYLQNDVISEAVASYEAALAIHPTLETYLAVGKIYLDEEEYQLAERWYEQQLLAQYPNEAATYEFGIQTQLLQGNEREAYQAYDLYQKRKLHSESVEEAMKPIWYSFDLLGDYTEVGGFSNTTPLAAVKQGETWGYINTSAGRILANLYQSAGTFGEMAPVVDSAGEAYYIDKDGNKKLTASYFLEQDPEVKKITQFREIQSNLVLAYDGNVWNYYDAGNYQKKFGGYRDATVITNGVGAVSENGNTWALISSEGELLTPFDYQRIVVDSKGVPCRTEVVIAEKDGNYQLLNRTTGEPISGNCYESAYAFNENSYAAVKKEGHWIFINEKGEEKDLGNFEEVKSFSVGVAAAKSNNMWGYINESGQWIIEPQFYDAEAFNGAGVAFVKTKEDKWQLLSLDRFHHG